MNSLLLNEELQRIAEEAAAKLRTSEGPKKFIIFARYADNAQSYVTSVEADTLEQAVDEACAEVTRKGNLITVDMVAVGAIEFLR